MPRRVFKEAVTSTMRAISGNQELAVSFGRGKPYIQGDRARIPLPEEALSAGAAGGTCGVRQTRLPCGCGFTT